MNKQDLVSAVAQETGLTAKQTAEVLSATFDAIEAALLKGESVKVPGFGVFSVKERAERTGVVPNTDKKIVIPAKKVVAFKSSKALKEKF